jgi:hypothetical protein
LSPVVRRFSIPAGARLLVEENEGGSWTGRLFEANGDFMASWSLKATLEDIVESAASWLTVAGREHEAQGLRRYSLVEGPEEAST